MSNQETQVEYRNEVRLSGLVASKVTLKDTAIGPIAKCTVSTDIEAFNKDGDLYIATYRHTVRMNGELAEEFATRVSKGSFVNVVGYLFYWTDKRNDEVKAEIMCHQFDY